MGKMPKFEKRNTRQPSPCILSGWNELFKWAARAN